MKGLSKRFRIFDCRYFAKPKQMTHPYLLEITKEEQELLKTAQKLYALTVFSSESLRSQTQDHF